MIIIVGASASGKTEITKVLISKYNYHKCVTTTTRQPRVGEVDGIDYHFLPTHVFLERVNNDEFVEYNEYRDNYYGIQRKDITADAVVILEPNGANELLEKMSDHIFLVLVESSKAKREERMIDRGDNLDEVSKRLSQDDKWFNKKKLLKVDLLIHNDKQTLEELAKLIHTNYKQFNKNKK